VDVDDTPLVVRAARIDADRVFIALSDGAEELLDPTTLTIDQPGVMRCWVRDRRLEARIANSAAAVLAELIDDTQPGAPALILGGRRFPFGPRLPPAPAAAAPP
jgi:hypothetical protein